MPADKEPAGDKKSKKPKEALPSYDESAQELITPPSYEEKNLAEANPHPESPHDEAPPSYEAEGEAELPPSFQAVEAEEARIKEANAARQEAYKRARDNERKALGAAVNPQERLIAAASRLQQASQHLKAAVSKPGFFNFFSTKKQTRRAEIALIDNLAAFKEISNASPLAKAIVIERVLLAISRDLQTERRGIEKNSRLAQQVSELLREAKTEKRRIQRTSYPGVKEGALQEAVGLLEKFTNPAGIGMDKQTQKKYSSILEDAKKILPDTFKAEQNLVGARRKPGL